LDLLEEAQNLGEVVTLCFLFGLDPLNIERDGALPFNKQALDCLDPVLVLVHALAEVYELLGMCLQLEGIDRAGRNNARCHEGDG